jgi:hypothetical protein
VHVPPLKAVLLRDTPRTNYWSWALLEKPLVVQPLNNFPTFYGNRRFITVFTRTLQLSLFWTGSYSVRTTPSFLSNTKKKQTPWPQSASELYRPSDRRLSAKLVPTFADRECHVVSVTDPYGRILGFLEQNRYFFFQVALQLYPRGWVDPVPDPLLPRKCVSAGNRIRNYGRGSVTTRPQRQSFVSNIHFNIIHQFTSWPA